MSKSCTAAGTMPLTCTAPSPVGEYGRLNAFFLLEDHPNEYNLPEAPRQPFRGQGKRYAASLGVGAALAGLAAIVFAAGKNR